MATEQEILARYQELDREADTIVVTRIQGTNQFAMDIEDWSKWSTSATSLIHRTLGDSSVHYQLLRKTVEERKSLKSTLDYARGIFRAAKEDFEKGYYASITTKISGELFNDFLKLSKKCLEEGSKDAAAVVACAALEDSLKRYAILQGISVEGKNIQDVVNALKSKGLISGVQKSLLDTMPNIRDKAMHAEWDKIKAEDVGSVIGFVEQFLLKHF